MSRRKAALLELYDSHIEVLYSQLLFLQSGGYDVTLIVSEAHRETVAQYGFDGAVAFVSVTQKKGIAQWRELWRIRAIILGLDIGTVVLNTAHSNPVRNFCLLPFPKRIVFFGVMHGVNKLQGSLTQRIISRRIPSYFLLSDYMLEKALRLPHRGLRFAVCYPAFHPPFNEIALPKKPAGQLWIAIPGSVEYKRRDYESLLMHFAGLKQKPDIRFLLLGNGDHLHGNGPELRRKVKALGVDDYFVFFNGFVPNNVLHTYLRHSDAVMPLIHPVNADMEKYLENQISGAFHLAFAYRKPLLMHDYFRRYQDFVETGLFYSLENLGSFLQGLPQQIAAFGESRYDNPKWTLEYQAANYCAFLESGQ